MQPTYSFPEIKSLISSIDETAIEILRDLVDEEQECYSYYELRAISRFFTVKYKSLVANEVKAEFLLSFN